MKTHWKISTKCCQLLLILCFLLVGPTVVKADQSDAGVAAYNEGNYHKAFKLFKPLAEQGDAQAQFHLGTMYYNGKGVPQDYREAEKWYRKGAEQEDAAAQFMLGVMYYYGKGVPQDYKEAVKWYRKVAEQGDDAAQYALGTIYHEGGKGVPQDYQEAVKWFRRAAEQGNGEAQFNLGNMYTKGWGVPQDYVQAHKWLSLFASRYQGKTHEMLIRNRDVIEKKMTSAQVAKAQKLAREWKPKTWKELSQQN